MALRAGSVGLGREAGLGARRGWTRRRARAALAREGAGGVARRRLWTRAGPFPWIAPAAAGAARPGPLLFPPPAPSVLRAAGSGGAAAAAGGRVPGPAPRLGRRLAAGLELVRTRGIRLFN